MKFWLTQHSKDRFKERILDGNDLNGNLNVHILQKISGGKDITNKVYDECPRYILSLYEKYKELGITIMLSDGIIFITKKRKGTYELYDVLTCYKHDENYLKQYKNTVLSREQIFMKIKEIKMKLK